MKRDNYMSNLRTILICRDIGFVSISRLHLVCILFCLFLHEIGEAQSDSISVTSGHSFPANHFKHEVGFIANSEWVYVLGDVNLVIWDYRRNKAIAEFSNAEACAVNEVGSYLAISSPKSVVVWELPSLKKKFEFSISSARMLKFVGDGSLLAFVSSLQGGNTPDKIGMYAMQDGELIFDVTLNHRIAALASLDDYMVVGGEKSLTAIDFIGTIKWEVTDKSLGEVMELSSMEPGGGVAVYSEGSSTDVQRGRLGTFLILNQDRQLRPVSEFPALGVYRDIFLIDGSFEKTRQFIEARLVLDQGVWWGVNRNKFDVDTKRNLYVELRNYGDSLLLRSLNDHHPIKSIGWSCRSADQNWMEIHQNWLFHQRLGELVVWNLVRLRPTQHWVLPGDDIKRRFFIDSVKNHIQVYHSNSSQTIVREMDWNSGQSIRESSFDHNGEWSLTADGTWLSGDGKYEPVRLHRKPGELISKLNLTKGMFVDHNSFVFLKGGGFLCLLWSQRSNNIEEKGRFEIVRIDQRGNTQSYWRGSAHSISSLTMSSDESRLGWIQDEHSVVIWDVERGREVHRVNGLQGSRVSFCFRNERDILISTEGVVREVDTSSKFERAVVALPEAVITMMISAKLNRLFAATPTGKVYIVDLNDSKGHVLLYARGARHYAVVSSKGFYKASPAARGSISVFSGKDVFFGEETRFWDRPDQIMEAAALTDPNANSVLARIYSRTAPATSRLKMNTNLNELPIETSQSELVVRGECLSSTQRNILLMKVNGVPIHGMRGIEIESNWSFPVRLASGANEIVCKCTSSDSKQEATQSTEVIVRHTPGVGRIHFIGLAADSFINSQFNLRFPVKDMRDLVTTLSRVSRVNQQQFSFDTLFNQNLSLEGLQRLKPRLMVLDPQDVVVVAYSGHGILNREGSFLMSTSASDFDDPGGPRDQSIRYEVLEDLLDSIPTQNRLVLIDACHSGSPQELIFRKMNQNGQTSNQETKGLGYDAYELFVSALEEYYAMAFANSGTFAIAACSKTEKAIEVAELGNGLFTKAVLFALRSTSTDTSGDNVVTVSELRSFVEHYVVNESIRYGKPHRPSTRNENVANDFVVRRINVK